MRGRGEFSTSMDVAEILKLKILSRLGAAISSAILCVNIIKILVRESKPECRNETAKLRWEKKSGKTKRKKRNSEKKNHKGFAQPCLLCTWIEANFEKDTILQKKKKWKVYFKQKVEKRNE